MMLRYFMSKSFLYTLISVGNRTVPDKDEKEEHKAYVLK